VLVAFPLGRLLVCAFGWRDSFLNGANEAPKVAGFIVRFFGALVVCTFIVLYYGLRLHGSRFPCSLFLKLFVLVSSQF